MDAEDFSLFVKVPRRTPDAQADHLRKPGSVGSFAAVGAGADRVAFDLRHFEGLRGDSFTPRAKRVFELSLREALQLGHNYIGTEHLLLGLLKEGEGVAAQVLTKLGADLTQVRETVIQLLSGYQRGEGEGRESVGAGVGGTGGPERQNSAILEQFGRNLTQAARENKLDPVIGRRTEMERVMQVLSRRTKNNPVLIGEPGVGKTEKEEVTAGDIVAVV